MTQDRIFALKSLVADWRCEADEIDDIGVQVGVHHCADQLAQLIKVLYGE